MPDSSYTGGSYNSGYGSATSRTSTTSTTRTSPTTTTSRTGTGGSGTTSYRPAGTGGSGTARPPSASQSPSVDPRAANAAYPSRGNTMGQATSWARDVRAVYSAPTTSLNTSPGMVRNANTAPSGGFASRGLTTAAPQSVQALINSQNMPPRSFAESVMTPGQQMVDRANTIYSPNALGSLYRNVGTYGIANRDLRSLAQQQLLGQTIAASRYGGRVTADLNPNLAGKGTVNPFKDDVATHWTGGNEPLSGISGNGYAVTIDKNGNVNYTRAFNSDGTIRSTNHMMGLNRGYVGISSQGVEPNSAQLSAASALGQNWFNPGANVSTHGYEAGTRVVSGERSVPPKNRRQEREGVALASAFTGIQDPGKRWSPTQIASAAPVTNAMTPPPVKTAAVQAPVPIAPPPPLPAKKPPAPPPDPADLPTPPGYFSQFAMTPSDIETLKQQAMKDYPVFSFDPWKVTQTTMGANIGALPGFMGPITRDQQRMAASIPDAGVRRPTAPYAPPVQTAMSDSGIRKPVAPFTPPSQVALADSGIRKTVAPYAAPVQTVMSDAGIRKPVSPYAPSQPITLSDAGIRKPVSPYVPPKADNSKRYASTGATIGGLIAGPIGTVIGATIGWQMGKTSPAVKQKIASNPASVSANVQSINELAASRGGGRDMTVTEKGFRDSLVNPEGVLSNPQQYTTLEQMLAALSLGIDPSTGKKIT